VNSYLLISPNDDLREREVLHIETNINVLQIVSQLDQPRERYNRF